MRVSYHQPSFLPWIGYWHKLASSDLHIVAAGVQFEMGGYQNRVRHNGAWLGVNIDRRDKGKPIKDVHYDTRSLDPVLRTIAQTAGSKRNPYRERIQLLLEALETAKLSDSLLDLNLTTLTTIRYLLKCTPMVAVDTQTPDLEHTKTERLWSALRRHMSTGQIEYLTGTGALSYIQQDQIPTDIRIEVQYTKEGVCSESILQLIATEEHPLQAILASCGTRPLA